MIAAIALQTPAALATESQVPRTAVQSTSIRISAARAAERLVAEAQLPSQTARGAEQAKASTDSIQVRKRRQSFGPIVMGVVTGLSGVAGTYYTLKLMKDDAGSRTSTR
jgi:hypothetical protein